MPLEPRQPGANLYLEVTHERSLVARLAVLLNAHDVSAFVYRADATGGAVVADAARPTARVEVEVQGGERQVTRAANRLRRVIGVHSVTVLPPAHDRTAST